MFVVAKRQKGCPKRCCREAMEARVAGRVAVVARGDCACEV